MRPPMIRVLAFCAALSVTGLACSNSGGSDATSEKKKEETTTTVKATTTTEAPTTTERSTTTTEGGSTTTPATEEQIIAFVEPLLLTVEDIGESSFVAEEPDPSGNTPCGLQLDTDYPNKAKIATLLSSESLKLGLQQTVRVYDNAQEASAAYDAILTDGLGCSKSDEGLAISDGQDVSTEVAVQGAEVEATGYSIKSQKLEGAIVVAHFADVVVVYQFVGAIGAADDAGATDPLVLAQAGLDKIISALPEN